MARPSPILPAVVAVVALVLVGCDAQGRDDPAASTPTPVPEPATSPVPDATTGPQTAARAPADDPSAAAPRTEVAISMSEFAFDPAKFAVPVGEAVTLTLTNDGEVVHEFMAGRQVKSQDGDTAHGYRQDLFAGIEPTVTREAGVAADHAHDDHAHDHGGFVVLADPGETVEVSFTAPPDKTGQWEIGCFQPGHYEAGMRGTLTVQ